MKYANITENNSSFRPIPDSDRYHITNLGNVYRVSKDGKSMWQIKSYTGGSNTKDSPVGKYRVVTLYSDGVKLRRYVHQLVLLSFVGPRPEPHYECCHYNGIREDNSLKNLRWDTPKANAADKKRKIRGY